METGASLRLYCELLMLSMLGENFSKPHFKNIFHIFPRKQVLTFHANCPLVKGHFVGKIRSMYVINLLSAEFAQNFVQVKYNSDNCKLYLFPQRKYRKGKIMNS